MITDSSVSRLLRRLLPLGWVAFAYYQPLVHCPWPCVRLELLSTGSIYSPLPNPPCRAQCLAQRCWGSALSTQSPEHRLSRKCSVLLTLLQEMKECALFSFHHPPGDLAGTTPFTGDGQGIFQVTLSFPASLSTSSQIFFCFQLSSS